MKRITGMAHELIEDGKIGNRFRRRMVILGPIENMTHAMGSSTKSKTEINRPKFEQLKNIYSDLCKDLSHKYPNSTIKTLSEDKINKIIKEHTDLRFDRSIWIGNQNVDFFCYAIGALHKPNRKGQPKNRQRMMRGLVLEIDGGIHNEQTKLLKDQKKYKNLDELNIAMLSIENCDANSNPITNLIKKLKETPRLDSRARERLRRKVFVYTIVCHSSDDTLSELYGYDFNTHSINGVI